MTLSWLSVWCLSITMFSQSGTFFPPLCRHISRSDFGNITFTGVKTGQKKWQRHALGWDVLILNTIKRVSVWCRASYLYSRMDNKVLCITHWCYWRCTLQDERWSLGHAAAHTQVWTHWTWRRASLSMRHFSSYISIGLHHAFSRSSLTIARNLVSSTNTQYSV